MGNNGSVKANISGGTKNILSVGHLQVVTDKQDLI